jgi:hypothetical protein
VETVYIILPPISDPKQCPNIGNLIDRATMTTTADTNTTEERPSIFAFDVEKLFDSIRFFFLKNESKDVEERVVSERGTKEQHEHDASDAPDNTSHAHDHTGEVRQTTNLSRS